MEMDLREMLDEVARRLKNYESENGFKQSCSYENRHFYNKLYFNPGIVRDRDRPPSFIGSLQNLDIQWVSLTFIIWTIFNLFEKW